MIRGIRIGRTRLALVGVLAFLGAFGCSSDPTAPSQGSPAASDPAPTPPSGNESTQIDAWIQDDDDTRDRAEGFWDTISFDWELQKAVDPDEIVMEESESREVTYTLTATRDPPQAAGVRGEVCVQNTGDSETKNLTIAIVVQANRGAGFEPILEPVALPVDEVERDSVSCFGFEVNFDPIADATEYGVVAQVRIDNHSDCATRTATCPFGPDADAEFDLPEEPDDALAEVTDVLACPEGFTCTLLEPEIDSTCTVTNSSAPPDGE